MATLDSNSLQTDKTSFNSLSKSILPPIPKMASITTVFLEIFLSSFRSTNSRFFTFSKAYSHKGDFFDSSKTLINLTHLFDSLKPRPMKYPSPPLLPGPHKIK